MYTVMSVCVDLPVFDCPEATLYIWQDLKLVKIQLLITNDLQGWLGVLYQGSVSSTIQEFQPGLYSPIHPAQSLFTIHSAQSLFSHSFIHSFTLAHKGWLCENEIFGDSGAANAPGLITREVWCGPDIIDQSAHQSASLLAKLTSACVCCLLQELLTHTSLETHKLDLMAEISSLKLKLAAAEKDRRELDERCRSA